MTYSHVGILQLLTSCLRLIHQAPWIVFEHAHVWLLSPIEHHAHRPGSTKDVWILDGHLVVDVIGAGRREAFGWVRRVALEISATIQPRLIGEGHDVDHERVAFPAAARVAQP